MKLRIRDNSLRLRLTRSEVEKVRNSEAVEATIQFGPPQSQLTYRLESNPHSDSVRAEFQGQVIRILIPQPLAHDWASGTEVSLYSEQAVGENSFLKILVEKDFFCLKPRSHEHEDESDLYPHPNSATGVC